MQEKKILLVDNGTTLLDELRVLIPGYEVVRKWNELQNVDFDSFDLVVLSGSSTFAAEHNESLVIEKQRIVECTVPVIGICLGCEVIVSAFGGSLRELEQAEKGSSHAKVLVPHPVFSEKTTFFVYNSHRFTIDTVPEDFDVLAVSELGPQVLRHRTRPLWCLQFHPEHKPNETFGDEIFLSLLKFLLV